MKHFGKKVHYKDWDFDSEKERDFWEARRVNREELNRKFTLGGPVSFRHQRGHVVGMNDLNNTVTIELNGLSYPNVPYEEVKPYNANVERVWTDTKKLNLAFRSEYEHLKKVNASAKRLDRCLREWHARGVGTQYLIMESGRTKKTLIKRNVL